jgi:hypothetical protein
MSQDTTAEILGTTFNGIALLIYGGVSLRTEDKNKKIKNMMFLLIPILLIIMYYVIKNVSLLKEGKSTIAFDWGYFGVSLVANIIGLTIVWKSLK